MSTSKIFTFLRNSKKFFKVKFNFTFSFYKNLSFNKIAALNFSFLFNYFCFSLLNNGRKKLAKNNSNKSDFDYLLNLDNLDQQEKLKISNKKTPKILYISNSSETEDDKLKIKSKIQNHLYSKINI